MEFAKVVRKRRMIRAFKPDPVPEGSIRRILEFAQRYPSAGYCQEVAFVVVTSPAKRQTLRKLRALRSDAPVMIIPCVSEKILHDRYREPDKIRQDGTEIEWPIPFWWFDAGCSCMLIFLAAVNEGLAAAFAGSFRPELLKAELEVPEHFVPVGIVSIGYPDYENDIPSPSLKRGRRDFKDIVHYGHW